MSLALLSSFSFAQKEQTGVGGLMGNLHCTNFEWLAVTGISDKAALRIPVILDKKTYWYQLDTGADATIVYGSEAKRWGWEQGQRFVRVPNVNVGGLEIPAILANVRPEMKANPKDAEGTVGLDVLIGHIVVLDFPNQHFCVVPRADAPLDIGKHTKWVPAEIRDRKFFVTVKVNGTDLDAVFFDTGASLFDLNVDIDRWKLLTGRSGETEATKRITVNSWGKPVTFYGAPALGSLEVGPIRLNTPTVYYNGSQPDSFKKWPFRVQGAMGNAPFWKEMVVLDLGSHPAFGIFR